MYEPSSSNTILLFCSQTLPTAPRAVVTLRGPLSPHLPLDLSRIGMSPRRRRHEGTPPSPGELKNAACRPICHLTCQESGHRHGGGDRQAPQQTRGAENSALSYQLRRISRDLHSLSQKPGTMGNSPRESPC